MDIEFKPHTNGQFYYHINGNLCGCPSDAIRSAPAEFLKYLKATKAQINNINIYTPSSDILDGVPPNSFTISFQHPNPRWTVTFRVENDTVTLTELWEQPFTSVEEVVACLLPK